MANNTYDAIVVGTGVSGGWAAKELTEKGLKTLVLDRGPMVKHGEYPTAMKAPWELPYADEPTQEDIRRHPVHTRPSFYGITQSTKHWFVDDLDNPYVETKPFDWFRGYHVGGRSLMWGRQSYRFSEMDLEANGKEGVGVDWPIRYADLAPWYDYVENFIGVSGSTEHLAQLPDGQFLPPMELNGVEKEFGGRIEDKFGRKLIIGRTANLSAPLKHDQSPQRGTCQYRNLCMRGCPFGGYFSSNSSTLPWAEKTGNLTIRPFSVVHSIIYDEKKGKAVGVRIIDANTKQTTDYFSRIIFMNASALNTDLILLNSKSNRFPNGLGNDNGLLGKYVAFQNYRGSVNGDVDGYQDKYYYGRRTVECMMTNFRNVYKHNMDFVGGYMAFMGAWRDRGAPEQSPETIGAAYKDAMSEAGSWHMYMYIQGETVPKATNYVKLSDDKKDQWEIPLLEMNVDYDDNDERLLKDFLTQASETLETGGVKNIKQHDNHWAPGRDIHEMGGCRMGKDSKTSLLNGWNQFHNCKNVFVTDGACMTSTGTQSPSILYMALTARAANYAVSELKKGNL